MPLRLPPLRERTEDIPDLIRHFFSQALREGLPTKLIDPAGLEQLESGIAGRAMCANWKTWPGGSPRFIPQETISAAVIESELAQPALPTGGEEPRIEESLGAAVERHLATYFSSFEDGVPPAGLLSSGVAGNRISAAVGGAGPRPAATRSALLICSGVNRNTLRKKIRDLDIQVFRTSGG